MLLNTGISIKGATSVSYCMVCAYVREDNPRALASELSLVHVQSGDKKEQNIPHNAPLHPQYWTNIEIPYHFDILL